jgi:hypothetical protein
MSTEAPRPCGRECFESGVLVGPGAEPQAAPRSGIRHSCSPLHHAIRVLAAVLARHRLRTRLGADSPVAQAAPPLTKQTLAGRS